MRYAFVCLFAFLVACDREPSGSAAGPSADSGEVVIYSSIDEPYLRPILQRFEKQTGITFTIVTDTEATKSAGLAERIIAEKNRPQADVYWGNEIFHAIGMAEQGIFDRYRPLTATDIPAKWRGRDDLYTCIGLRVRTIGISTREEHKKLTSTILYIHDLAKPQFKGKIAMAHPAFGTTSGHMAALYVVLGDELFRDFLRGLRANDIKILGGNSEVAKQVAAGTIAAGLTDNDDVANIKAEGGQIDSLLPDQGETGFGTLLIPGTVAMIKNAPHPENAKKLIDFLCEPSVEKELIDKRFAAYSVRDTAAVRAMEVDYVKVAEQMKNAIEMTLNILQERRK